MRGDREEAVLYTGYSKTTDGFKNKADELVQVNGTFAPTSAGAGFSPREARQIKSTEAVGQSRGRISS